MTVAELDNIRRRWSDRRSDIDGAGDPTRTVQERTDVAALIAEVALVGRQHSECMLLLEDIATDTRPMPGGYSARARQLLIEQGCPGWGPGGLEPRTLEEEVA